MENSSEEMDVLDEMESLVETIIASGERVRLAIEEGRSSDAQIEAQQLHASGTAELFNELMVETLATRGKALGEALDAERVKAISIIKAQQ